MNDESAKQREAEVFLYETRLEKKKSEADALIDKTLKEWADGKLSKEQANAIIEESLATREKIEPAGSCLAITMARDDGYFFTAASSESVREKLQTVTHFDRVVDNSASNTNKIFDKALADFEAGRISKEAANKIIAEALKEKDAIDTAGSCRALTAARASGYFVGRIK